MSSHYTGIPHPIVRTHNRPVRETSGDAGILLAAKATRIDRRRVEFNAELLSNDELAWLMNVWDGGDGKLVPFWLHLPGEDPSPFVFADDITITHANAGNRSCSIVLMQWFGPVDAYVPPDPPTPAPEPSPEPDPRPRPGCHCGGGTTEPSTTEPPTTEPPTTQPPTTQTPTTEPTTTQPPTGACCLANGDCINGVTEAVCVFTHGGIWHENGTCGEPGICDTTTLVGTGGTATGTTGTSGSTIATQTAPGTGTVSPTAT